ncbi:MAG TPA: hypothetical protein VF221_04070 [Chloroflexota bacterium]
MDITERLHANSPSEWHSWLEEHAAIKKEIWLVFYTKATGKQGLSYAEAVEEALCFGWVDGQSKGIDAETYALRFTPRRPRSSWTLANRSLARRLIEEGRMSALGLRVLPTDNTAT